MTIAANRLKPERHAAWVAAPSALVGRALRSGTAEYVAAEGMNRCCRFLLLLMVARHVGAAGFGDWVIGVAVATVLSNAGDLGLATEITRDLATRPARLRLILQNLWVSAVVAAAASGVALVVMSLLLSDGDARTVLLCAGAGGVLESTALLLLAPLRAMNRLRAEAASRALQGASLLVGAVVLLATSGSAMQIAVLFPLVGAGSVLVAACVLTVHFGIVRPRADWSVLRALVGRSFPVLGTTLLFFVYFRIDAFILERIRGAVAVGTYGAAFNFVFGFAFVPLMFGRTMLSRFSASRDAVELRNLYRRSIALVLAFGATISLLLIALTPVFLGLYGASFAGARAPYVLLIVAHMLYLATNMHVQLLFSRGAAHVALGLTGGALALNIGVNLVLIPAFGSTGAAMTMIVSEATLLMATVLQTRRIIRAAGEASGEGAPLVTLCVAA